jgi:hypothetical protein
VWLMSVAKNLRESTGISIQGTSMLGDIRESGMLPLFSPTLVRRGSRHVFGPPPYLADAGPGLSALLPVSFPLTMARRRRSRSPYVSGLKYTFPPFCTADGP